MQCTMVAVQLPQCCCQALSHARPAADKYWGLRVATQGLVSFTRDLHTWQTLRANQSVRLTFLAGTFLAGTHMETAHDQHRSPCNPGHKNTMSTCQQVLCIMQRLNLLQPLQQNINRASKAVSGSCAKPAYMLEWPPAGWHQCNLN